MTVRSSILVSRRVPFAWCSFLRRRVWPLRACDGLNYTSVMPSDRSSVELTINATTRTWFHENRRLRPMQRTVVCTDSEIGSNEAKFTPIANNLLVWWTEGCRFDFCLEHASQSCITSSKVCCADRPNITMVKWSISQTRGKLLVTARSWDKMAQFFIIISLLRVVTSRGTNRCVVNNVENSFLTMKMKGGI